MKENNIIEDDIKKPLIEIDNDLIEMSKNLKIISSLKDDIEELMKNLPNNNNDDNITSIKDKYNKIKTQIKKFMNKKKFIYNYIDNEKLSKKNLVNNNNIIEEENENLIEENTKLESIKENINKMQNKITNLINKLDNKLSEKNIRFEKEGELIEEIKKNDIGFNDNEIINKEQFKIKSSLLNIKAEKYNEETKELEEANKVINEIKKGTDEMKLISNSQGYTINNLLDEHNYIGNNIDKGTEQIKKYKKANESNNTNLIWFLSFVIILIIIFSCLIYYKIKK